MRRIGIIGGGRMGSALAAALRRAGYDVAVAHRGEWLAVARDADVLIIALTWNATSELATLGDAVVGKVVITCTNVETEGGLAVPAGTSGAEAIARELPSAHVVSAFNHLYAELLDDPGGFDGAPLSVFFCGDDGEALAVTRELIEALGFDAVPSGPLANARMLEMLAELMVYLVRVRGYGPAGVALRLVRAPT
ncbi:MAG TPA: NAD(P)-binding domain-containing protein [Thermoanaerobaculia bacterium]|nr:NAD(P)-binding domain-containing protein [Thermoanaerobaculia bacterium]